MERMTTEKLAVLVRRMSRGSLLLGSLLALFGCAKTTTERLGLPVLPTVPHVELGRYLGIWYEIASFPQSFQEGCTGTRAEYALRADGELDVTNRCWLGSLDGEEKVARGRARIVDRVTNSKLEVSFFRPFWGDYWIVELGPSYEYAVVGHPSRDYLWILSREPSMAPETYNAVVARLQGLGYQVSRLNRTMQKGKG